MSTTMGEIDSMLGLGSLDAIVDNTMNGPSVVSQNDDFGSINAARGLSDTLESLKIDRKLNIDWNQIREIQVAMSKGDDSLLREALKDHPDALQEILDACIARADLAVTVDGEIAMVAVARNGEEATWHGLGKVVDRHLTVAETIRLIGADYTILKSPAQYEFGGVTRTWKDRFVLTRDDNGAPLGFVSKVYEPIQNTEVFGFLSEVVQDHGAHIETAGVLGDGERVWAMSKHANVFEPVKGDAVESYTLATTSHDGSGAVRFLGCSHRVVCANTRRNALNAGRGKGITIRHSKNFRNSMDDAARALHAADDAFQDWQDAASVMVKRDCKVDTYANNVLDRILDVSESDVTKGASVLAGMLDNASEMSEVETDLAVKKFERQIENRESLLEDILDRYESGTNTAPGTVWGAYNAVTEAIEHGSDFATTKGMKSAKRGVKAAARDRRLETVLVGKVDNAEKEAFDVARGVIA